MTLLEGLVLAWAMAADRFHQAMAAETGFIRLKNMPHKGGNHMDTYVAFIAVTTAASLTDINYPNWA